MEKDLEKDPVRVERTVRVKGKNTVKLTVKVVHEHVIYVVAEEVLNLPLNKKKSFNIKKGAVLVRNAKLDVDGVEFYAIFNDGVYSAIRSQGSHVPKSMAKEQAKVKLLRESFAWSLQRTWFLRKGSSAEDIAEYERRVQEVATELENVRDENKVKARDKAEAASSHKNILGHVGFASRSPILWSALRWLDRRTKATQHIVPNIGGRFWDLLRLAEAALIEKRDNENQVLQALASWRDGRAPGAKKALSLADRLENTACHMRKLSLAPYSRRGFPRIADDLDEVAKDLRSNDRALAETLLHRCRRAFLMMDGRQAIEEMHTVASCLHKAKAKLSPEDIDLLEKTIARVAELLRENGRPIDWDFKNPVIVDKVLPALRRALAAARSEQGYQSLEVYVALGEAAIPL